MNGKILAKYWTNLDEYSGEQWPFYLLFEPKVGQTVESEKGRRLKIVQIIHCFDFDSHESYLRLELHI